MARFFRVVCFSALIAVGAYADAATEAEPKMPLTLEPMVSETAAASAAALCSPCLQLTSQGINALLNVILNAGVVGSCAKLCGHLQSRGGQQACDLLCDAVGIKAFIQALKHTDLDPFYFCEEVKACPQAPDDAEIHLLAASAQPQSVAKGDDVQLSVALNVVNASGVGEFHIAVTGPVTAQISQGFLLATGIPKGTPGLAVKLTPQDDESAQPPVVWHPGTYSFSFEVCQGECGSKHPHSKVFGRQAGSFTLTESARTISI